MEDDKKKTIEFRYWQAGILLAGWVGLLVVVFYLGMVLGKIREGQDRILKLKELEKWEASRDEIPLTFYEELEKDNILKGKKNMPSAASRSVVNEEGAGKKQKDKKTHGNISEVESNGLPPKEVFLQVASFKEKARAESVAKAIQRQGYAALVRDVDLKDKGTWYRVEVGPFSSNGELQTIKNKLLEEDPTLFSRTSRENE